MPDLDSKRSIMAHSVLRFRGRALLMKDVDISIIFYFLSNLARKGFARDETWVADVTEKWRQDLFCSPPGCIRLELDKVLHTDERVSFVLRMLDAMSSEVEGFGPTVPVSWLTDLSIEDVEFVHPVSSPDILRQISNFRALLQSAIGQSGESGDMGQSGDTQSGDT
jgi:hypothetical protein